jgi:hypothetical protein
MCSNRGSCNLYTNLVKSLHLLIGTYEFFFGDQNFITFGPQMRVAIFFTCLCFLLLKGNAYAFTGVNDLRYTPTTYIENQQAVKSTYTDQDYIMTGDNDRDTTIAHLISDDIVDEDASSSLVRKYKLLARYYLVYSHPFILSYLCKCFQASPSSWEPIANITITQRILRI